MNNRRMAVILILSGVIVLGGITVAGYLIADNWLEDLDPTPPFSEQAGDEAQAPQDCYFMPSEDTLSLYLAPVYANNQLGEQVPDAAERYRVARQQGAFYYVTLDDTDVGWVSAWEGRIEGNCQIIAEDEMLLKEFGSLCLVTTTESAPLYSAPEMTDVTGTLPAGSYPVYVVSNERYLVGVGDTGGGWIDAAAGSLDGACEGVPDEPLASATTQQGARIWSAPGGGGEPLLTLDEGETVNILAGPLLIQPDPEGEARAEWYRVQTGQGVIGWVWAEELALADEPTAN